MSDDIATTCTVCGGDGNCPRCEGGGIAFPPEPDADISDLECLRAAAGELLTAAFILRDQPDEEWAQERFRSCAAAVAALLPDPDGEPIGRRLRSERLAVSLTQRDVAKRMGISVVHVSHVEAGKVQESDEWVTTYRQAIAPSPSTPEPTGGESDGCDLADDRRRAAQHASYGNVWAQKCVALIDKIRGEEAAVLQLIDERDHAHDWADRLAAAIAPADVIGEHSNANNPWANAVDYAEGLRSGAPSPSDITPGGEG